MNKFENSEVTSGVSFTGRFGCQIKQRLPCLLLKMMRFALPRLTGANSSFSGGQEWKWRNPGVAFAEAILLTDCNSSSNRNSWHGTAIKLRIRGWTLHFYVVAWTFYLTNTHTNSWISDHRELLLQPVNMSPVSEGAILWLVYFASGVPMPRKDGDTRRKASTHSSEIM